MDMIEAATFAKRGGIDTELVLEISLPPLDELARDWPTIEPILKRATDRVRGFEPIDILRSVMLGHMTMFLVREHGRIVAVATTQVHQFPRCRVLEVPFIAGTGLKRWWRPLLDALDAQAEATDCVDIAGWDRKGWARFGFETKGVALVRRLKD
jgi:hypothetical protein